MKTTSTNSGWEKDVTTEQLLAEAGFEELRPDTDETFPAPWLVVCFKHVWERRYEVVCAIVVGATATLILAFSLAKRFESTTQLMPLENQFNSRAAIFTKLRSEEAPLAGDLSDMDSPGALFIGMLESRTVQDRLIERFDL